MRKFSLFLVVLCLGISVPALADEGGPEGRGGHRMAAIHEIFKQLDLTPDQQAQLKAIHQQNHQNDEGLRTEARESGQALVQAMAGTASDDQLRAIRARFVKARQAVADARFEGMLRVRQVLSPAQRQKFAELYHRKHMGHGALGE